jgi:hypothetical protein
MAGIDGSPQPEVLKLGQVWNPDTGKASRDLGQTFKVRPCITVPAGKSVPLMDVDGPGVIQHIWLTVAEDAYRDLILRIYWDNEAIPSVETPVGDFFCNGFRKRVNVLALPINVNPSGGFNSFFPMPFRHHVRVTVENRRPNDVGGIYYAINYALTPIGEDEAYFHAQFRRTNPLPYKEDCTILDGVRGQGHYVGTYMAWQQNNNGWWGEGEIKFFMDGDKDFPTICGTGTEDYFGGAWCFNGNYKWPPDLHGTGSEDYLNQAYGMQENAFLRNGSSIFEGRTTPQFSLTPWDTGGYQTSYVHHLENPVRFTREVKVTIEHGHGNHLGNEMSSTAYWYAEKPAGAAQPPPVSKRLPVPRTNMDKWLHDSKAQCPGRRVPLNAEMRVMRKQWKKQFGKSE